MALDKDRKLIPIFRNNLAAVILNECIKVTALVDTGASVTAMNLTTLKLLRQHGQRCKIYSCNDINLTSISGNKLNVLGRVFIRLHLGQHLLRLPVFVINNMHNTFVLGSDALSKYKVVIDYENDGLYVKSDARLITTKTINILPKSNAIIQVYSDQDILIPGLIGKITENKTLQQKGLKAITVETSVSKKGTINYKIANESNKPIKLNQKTYIGTFSITTQTKNNSAIVQNDVKEADINLETDVPLEQLYSPYIEDTDQEISAINDSNESFNFEIAGEHLSQSQQAALTNLLNKNKHVFATHAYDLGEVKGPAFKINLKPGAQPVKCLPHRASPKQRQIIDEQVEQLLKAGVIEPCHSEFASPVVLVPKEYDDNGKILSQRLCIDYRKLNDLTCKSSYGLGRITDMLDSLGEAKPKYFTVIDCLQGYHQIKVHEDSKDMTAFVTHSGMYRYSRLPFGLVNASAHFMSCVNDLFRKLLYKGVLVYLDDILVYSETFEEHLSLLQQVMDILSKANMKLKLAKCRFALRKLKWLGHIVSAQGLSPDPKKLDAIKHFPTPKNLREVRGFVGMCSFYRRFIPNFSKLSHPLTKLTRKDTPFKWSDECQKSFEILKGKLLEHPIVGYPQYDQPFILYTDSSGYSLAGVLCQKQGEIERIIACAGRNMLPAETRYSTFEKEALAIFYCFKQFDSYIRYTHVDVVTDCKSLCEILTKRPVSARISKWTYYLCQYDYSITYRQGAKNHVDALSRIKYSDNVSADDIEPPINPFIDSLSINEISFSQQNDNSAEAQNQLMDNNTTPYGEKLTLDIIEKEQKLDSKLFPIINYLINGLLPDDEKFARKIIFQSANYNVTNDLLYHQQHRRAKDGQQLDIQLVIPSNLRLTILKEHHENLGHRGTPAIFNSISKKYFWENMYKDCYDHVHSCHTCMQHKHKQKKDRDELHPIPVSNRPFMTWFIDPVGQLPKTTNNNSYILTCVDSFSKLIEVIPLPNITSYSLAKAFYENIICRYGCCERIITDMGANLCSAMMEHLFKMCKSEHIKSTSFHHETVGQCERGNQIIERILAKYINEHKTNWDEYLPLARFSHNITPNEATKVSPYLIIHGREPCLSLDIALQKPDKINRSMENDLEDLITKVTTLDTMVKENIDKSKIFMKKYYDKYSTPNQYKVGQLVWLYLYKFPKHKGGHFKIPYVGPFRIIGQEGVNFRLRRVADNVILPLPIHPNRLQLVYDRRIRPPIAPITPPRMSPEDENLLAEHIIDGDIETETETQNGQANNTFARPESESEATSNLSQAVAAPHVLTTDTGHLVSVNNDLPHEQSQLPTPSDMDISVYRQIHDVPKARKINNTVWYYIIYEDQRNKNIGNLIPENDLNVYEKQYIENHKDKIKMMRTVARKLPDD